MSARDRTWFAVVIALTAVAVGLRLGDVRGEFVFAAASIALMALAWLLGEATDQAGNTAGPRVSALLNATFGNLPEVVIVILAINAGLEDIARASIIGSVIGNILLILGLSLILGGWKNGIQTFNERVATTNSSMLILGVAGLGLPTLFAALHIRRVGRGAVACGQAQRCSCATGPTSSSRSACRGSSSRTSPAAPSGRRARPSSPSQSLRSRPAWSRRLLVDSIKPTVETLGVPRPFVGLILVPFVGNVAEHFSAVRLAYRNRVDFAMGIAYGSGIQIALGASGIAVFASIALGNELSLVFDPFQLAALAAAASSPPWLPEAARPTGSRAYSCS